mmetsp:Transcript_18119/g.40742  ORF Transcript_18119/g.40742 Transcript_18119/m.40742 type:complete len:311 (+) Transcript_18119:134-1066(+)
MPATRSSSSSLALAGEARGYGRSKLCPPPCGWQRRVQRLSSFFLLGMIASLLREASSEDEGDTCDWAVPVSHSSGQTVWLIASQVMVLVWKLDPVTVEAEWTLVGLHGGVGAEELQFGLFLNGELAMVRDWPQHGGLLLTFHLTFDGRTDGEFLEAQLQMSTPDAGPVGRMTGQMQLQLRPLTIERAQHPQSAGGRDGNADSRCPAALLGGECHGGPVEDAHAVGLRRQVLDDVDKQVRKFAQDQSWYANWVDGAAMRRLVKAHGFCAPEVPALVGGVNRGQSCLHLLRECPPDTPNPKHETRHPKPGGL